jgi:hypothetical protein
MPMPVTSRLQGRRLLIFIYYRGPWERLADWLLAVGPDGGVRRVVPEDSWRGRLGMYCDGRDTAWRNRWAARASDPPARWARNP